MPSMIDAALPMMAPGAHTGDTHHALGGRCRLVSQRAARVGVVALIVASDGEQLHNSKTTKMRRRFRTATMVFTRLRVPVPARVQRHHHDNESPLSLSVVPVPCAMVGEWRGGLMHEARVTHAMLEARVWLAGLDLR